MKDLINNIKKKITTGDEKLNETEERYKAIQSHINLLGLPARDKITGFSGIISSVSFELYGCIQAVITPEIKDGEIKSGHWLDVTRLELTGDTPAMDLPDFSAGYVAEGKKGAAPKPERMKPCGTSSI